MVKTEAEVVEEQTEAKENVDPSDLAPHEYPTAYERPVLPAGDYRDVPGDWKTSRGSSRKTLDEIRREQFERYKEVREAGKTIRRENPPEEYFKGGTRDVAKSNDALAKEIQEKEQELAELRKERDQRAMDQVHADGVKAQVDAVERVYGPLSDIETKGDTSEVDEQPLKSLADELSSKSSKESSAPVAVKKTASSK